MDLPFCFDIISISGIGVYVLTDGFSLGVGILLLLAPRQTDRDAMMESISRYWEGNETWLVLGGSLLLAAFPVAYYVLLPALYLPIILMLLALISRGIALEFRFHADRFRSVSDYAFAAGSVLEALMQGFVLGGFIQGIPTQRGVFTGSAFGFLSVLGVGCGIGLVGGYALLGAGWLIGRTGGATAVFGRTMGRTTLSLTAVMMALVGGWSALTQPDLAQHWFGWPRVLPEALLPLAAVGILVLLWRGLAGGRERQTFLLAIVAFILGFGGLVVSFWPFVVPPRETIWTAVADRTGLQFVGVGLAVLLPVILAYLGHAYWVFRGDASSASDPPSDTGKQVGARHISALPNDPDLN
jgi:cytochrome d ubiquinol oxidase subunit II